MHTLDMTSHLVYTTSLHFNQFPPFANPQLLASFIPQFCILNSSHHQRRTSLPKQKRPKAEEAPDPPSLRPSCSRKMYKSTAEEEQNQNEKKRKEKQIESHETCYVSVYVYVCIGIGIG